MSHLGNMSLEELYEQWTGAKEVLHDPGVIVLFADYDVDGYEGYASCIYKQDGALWEANCSYCSCNGLDDFTPEVTSVEALKMRRYKFPDELWAII